MAEFKAALLGMLRGKVGNSVAAKWKSKNVLKALGGGSSKPPTIPQLAVQSKFKIASSFLNHIPDVIAAGYAPTGDLSGMNQAMQLVLTTAILGVYPNFTLDFAKIKLSKGALVKGGDDAAVVAAAGRLVNVNWEMNLFPGALTLPTDVATLVFYSVEKQQFVLIYNGPSRDKLTYSLHIPTTFLGNTVHAWMFFSQVDGKRVSESDYLGKVTVIA